MSKRYPSDTGEGINLLPRSDETTSREEEEEKLGFWMGNTVTVR